MRNLVKPLTKYVIRIYALHRVHEKFGVWIKGVPKSIQRRFFCPTRRKEQLSRSKLKQAFLIDSDTKLFKYLIQCIRFRSLIVWRLEPGLRTNITPGDFFHCTVPFSILHFGSLRHLLLLCWRFGIFLFSFIPSFFLFVFLPFWTATGKIFSCQGFIVSLQFQKLSNCRIDFLL